MGSLGGVNEGDLVETTGVDVLVKMSVPVRVGLGEVVKEVTGEGSVQSRSSWSQSKDGSGGGSIGGVVLLKTVVDVAGEDVVSRFAFDDTIGEVVGLLLDEVTVVVVEEDMPLVGLVAVDVVLMSNSDTVPFE